MDPAMATLRTANREDIAAMHRVRLAVRENVLTSAVAEGDYIPAIEDTGRGWVVEAGGEIVAFAVGNARTGNIWALFVHPDHEGRGYGRRLHDEMVAWLHAQGMRDALAHHPAADARRALLPGRGMALRRTDRGRGAPLHRSAW